MVREIVNGTAQEAAPDFTVFTVAGIPFGISCLISSNQGNPSLTLDACSLLAVANAQNLSITFCYPDLCNAT
jgi:hypothetical protein